MSDRFGTRRARRLATGLLLALPVLPACLKVPTELDQPEGERGAPANALELLERHIAASGGSELLATLGQRTVEARVVFKAQEGCEEGDSDCMWEDTVGQLVLNTTADGRMYRRMIVGANVLEKGFDGERGWQLQADPQMLLLEDPAATPILREDSLLHWYFDIEGRELALELLPAREDEQGRTLDGIRWFAATPDWPESEKWFDRATGLLAEEIERDTESGDMVLRQYSDYREVDGARVAWRIDQVTMADGLAIQTIELHVQAVNHREVDAKNFAIPVLAPVEPQTDELVALLDQARAVVQAEPKLAEAQLQLARVAFATGHFEEAGVAARATLKLAPKDLEAFYILARVELLAGNLAAAESNLTKAIALGLREDEAARQRAWIHLRRGQWDKAAKQLESAGNAALAERYARFQGPPLKAKMGGDGCRTRVPIEFVEGAVVFDVMADGDKLRLLLDTGASDLIITDAKARSLVIGEDARAPLSAGGPELPQGQLDQLTLGDLAISNVPVAMFPAEQFGMVVGLDGVDGILGLRPFLGRQLTVDFEAKVLEIVQPAARCKKQSSERRVGEGVPFFLHETHYVYVLGHMREAEGVYLINTGMRGADLTANEGAFGFAGIGAPPIHASQGAALASVDRFRLGTWTREDLTAAWGFLAQNTTSDGFRLDGMIGLGVLGTGSWTLDFEQQRLFLRRPSAAPAKPSEAPPTPDKPKAPAKSPG